MLFGGCDFCCGLSCWRLALFIVGLWLFLFPFIVVRLLVVDVLLLLIVNVRCSLFVVFCSLLSLVVVCLLVIVVYWCSLLLLYMLFVVSCVGCRLC